MSVDVKYLEFVDGKCPYLEWEKRLDKSVRGAIRVRINIKIHVKRNSMKKKKTVRIKDYKEHLFEQLQDPQEAAAYLNAALHDDDPHAFLLALRDIAESQGGMSQLAKQTDLNRENLYRTLSLKGNPRLFNIMAVINAFDLELTVQARGKGKHVRS
jgi:probable addiction module antidote protein